MIYLLNTGISPGWSPDILPAIRGVFPQFSDDKNCVPIRKSKNGRHITGYRSNVIERVPRSISIQTVKCRVIRL